jgi:hypothetical protein
MLAEAAEHRVISTPHYRRSPDGALRGEIAVAQFSIGVNAFHEKAGRSQVGSFVFSLDKVFSPVRAAAVATLPSALFDERFCSLGASWVFSFQPVLPPDYRPPFIL